ncbi:CHAT domain-containing tetratricopeptide repeat protein [Novosphingobium sp. KN65.2]|uniref:CHAT domain-containing protein n=1 Tax=Novosphingobium sp. KN65.2 TaxID=1478134 RepID=UPI0009E97A0A|nr:CHAT domain-containing tetratricopeptide repeat protein [Novosphingobium sp. KN65.2]
MKRIVPWLAATAFALAQGPALASPVAISASDSFRVGDHGVLCTAQRRSEDSRFTSMFDRGYDVVCRDAATPVARLYALKAPAGDPAKGTDKDLSCANPAEATIADLGGVAKVECRNSAGLNYTIYRLRRGGETLSAEGLSAYDSALQVGLRALAADRPVSGEISVATTNAGDPAAFARVQAASLDPAQALAAGYDRNIEGSYAEASEFFEALVGRVRINDSEANKAAEYYANAAMQQSNLGHMAEADRLFADAAKVADGSDALFGRLFRNLQAMHRLNQLDAEGALVALDTAVPAIAEAAGSSERLTGGFIDKQLSQRLQVDDDAMIKLGGGATHLSETERGTLLDAQSHYLRGVARRMKGEPDAARSEFATAMSDYASVRGGAVRSMHWMIASIFTEQAQLAEAQGKGSLAESHLREALRIYEDDYPESATVLSAKARLAALQARHGAMSDAIPAYRQLVSDAAHVPGGSEALRALIKPYFEALVAKGDMQSANDFFLASQAMVRPGVAQTQAVFARELSGGSDEASSLFRQSISLTRDIVVTDAEIARLGAIDTRTPEENQLLVAAQAHRQQVGADQTALLAQLAAFPKFRVMASSTLELEGMQAALKPGEAYYKLLIVDETAYGMLVRPDNGRIFKIKATRDELEKLTDAIRDSIVIEESNQLVTNPFNLVAAHKMYDLLFGAVVGEVPSIRHLVFEPDGPLLKLPANVLVMDQASVDAYVARQKAKNPDEFDFTGTAWLGRDRMISTAVSAQSFIDVRRLPASRAARNYLGMGQNAPAARLEWAPHSEQGRDPCDWALSVWNKPISSAELRLASLRLGGMDNEVVTEEGFSDTALREREDLKDFRIIQFATHGLVTAPRPGCPARPALVTSFGQRDSDGLLSFKEIFDLRLDADTVILSACDTAGAATAAATREAGIGTGGNFALDGLVRAFVGAGARSVIASHWPVPDDYDATKRLMSLIYEDSSTRPIGESMRLSENLLMDDPLTSHPYYWAAFAIVGDAAKPLSGGGTGQLADTQGAVNQKETHQ